MFRFGRHGQKVEELNGDAMDEPKLEIRHGSLIDIDGPARKFGVINIVPAKVELEGTAFQSSHHLAEHGSEIKLLVEQSDIAVWVRGRAQQLFLISNNTEEERPEKSFFGASFVAILPGDNGNLIGVPFECSDYYGRSGLTFSSDNAPPKAVKDQIAEAFWGLLLLDPDDVADYRATMYHPGISMIIEFGIESGQPFILERDE
jgi:hypothetical protein